MPAYYLYLLIFSFSLFYPTSSLEAQTKKSGLDILALQSDLDTIEENIFQTDYDSLYVATLLSRVQEKIDNYILENGYNSGNNIPDNSIRYIYFKHSLYLAEHQKRIGQIDQYLDNLHDLEENIEYSKHLNDKDSTTMRMVCVYLRSQYVLDDNQEKVNYYKRKYSRWHPNNLTNYLHDIYPLIKQGKHQKAKQTYKKALQQFIKGDNTSYRKTIFFLHLAMSDIQIAGNELDSAKYYLNLAKEYKLKGLESDVLKQQGVIARHEKKFKQARSYLNEALAQEKKATNDSAFHPSLSDLYTELGHIDYDEQKHEAALTNYQLALTYLIPSFKDTNITANPIIKSSYADIGFLEILSYKIKTLHQLNSKNSKGQLLLTGEVAIQLIDTIRSEYISDEDQYSLSKNSRLIYDWVIETAISLNQINSAFDFSEKSKSIVLYDVLRVKQIDYYNDKENGLFTRRKKLEIKLHQLEQGVQEENTIDEISDLQIDLGKINQQIKKTPEFQNIFDNIKTTTIDMIRAKLVNDEIFIEFHKTEKYIFAFLIEKSNPKINIKKIEYTTVLDNAIRHFNNDIQNSNQNPYTYTKNAHFIYQILFVDSFPEYFDKNGNPPKSLIIVPDGNLSNLAYDALITHPIEEKNSDHFTEHPYLQNSTSITYWPSASLALNTLYNNQTIEYPYHFYGSAPSFDGLDFDSLDNANEIERISDILNISNDALIVLAKDKMATIKDFIKYSSKAEIIYLATHGVELSSTDSYLVFSIGGDSTQRFRLTIKDIYTLDLRSKLVVLSACETGVGESVTGEGMITLARAFLYAGAECVVSTFWQVDDTTSRNLMTYFYEELKDGKRKDIALHNAKKKLLREASTDQRANPLEWAGFHIIGNTNPLYEKSKNWVYLLLLPFPFIIWWWRKRKKDSYAHT